MRNKKKGSTVRHEWQTPKRRKYIQKTLTILAAKTRGNHSVAHTLLSDAPSQFSCHNTYPHEGVLAHQARKAKVAQLAHWPLVPRDQKHILGLEVSVRNLWSVL